MIFRKTSENSCKFLEDQLLDSIPTKGTVREWKVVISCLACRCIVCYVQIPTCVEPAEPIFQAHDANVEIHPAMPRSRGQLEAEGPTIIESTTYFPASGTTIIKRCQTVEERTEGRMFDNYYDR